MRPPDPDTPYSSIRYRKPDRMTASRLPERISTEPPPTVLYCTHHYRKRGEAPCGRPWHPELSADETEDWLILTDLELGVTVVRCPRHHTRQAWRSLGLPYTRPRELRAMQAFLSDVARYGDNPPGPETPIPERVSMRAIVKVLTGNQELAGRAWWELKGVRPMKVYDNSYMPPGHRVLSLEEAREAVKRGLIR